MKKKLKELTVPELVNVYVEIGAAQGEAEFQPRKFNRLFDKMVAIEQELKQRSGDQRSALLPLYEHRNMQVRLNAVKATLAVAPQEARRALEDIASSGHFPQAGDAGMSIVALERGIFKPK